MLTTKANARSIAQANSDKDRITRAVVRHKSKFTAMTYQSAKLNGFTIIEIIEPKPQQEASKGAGCKCSEQVNAKVDGGELRQALSRSHSQPLPRKSTRCAG